MVKRYCCFIMLAFSLTCWGESTQHWLNTRHALKTAWDLSHAYYHGVGVEVDRVRALAWQYVYVTTLPKTYPGGYRLLVPFKQDMTKEQIAEALKLAVLYKEKYHLQRHLTEAQLDKVFKAKETDIQLPPQTSYQSTGEFFKAVGQISPEEKKHLQNKYHFLEESAEHPIVYGRVLSENGTNPLQILSNESLGISINGFFLTDVSSPLLLTGPGLISQTIDLAADRPVQSLGDIRLLNQPKKSLASIVGKINPLAANNSWVVIKQSDIEYNDEQPFLTPTVSLTFLPDGRFYAKDISPGRYDIITKLNGQVKRKLGVVVHKGQVKTL